MYEQHSLTSLDAIILDDNIDQYCAFWIYLEISAFYGLLLSAIIYLFTIQFVGNFGNQSPEAKKYLETRYKFDALDYYKVDVEWFSFGCVLLVINITGLKYVIDIHSGSIRWINAQGVLVNDDSYGRGEIYQLYLLIAGRVA